MCSPSASSYCLWATSGWRSAILKHGPRCGAAASTPATPSASIRPGRLRVNPHRLTVDQLRVEAVHGRHGDTHAAVAGGVRRHLRLAVDGEAAVVEVRRPVEDAQL